MIKNKNMNTKEDKMKSMVLVVLFALATVTVFAGDSVKTIADKPQTRLEENRSLIDSVKPAGATNITLASGVVYTNAVISRIEADGLVLKWRSGMVKVLFTELTKKTQLEFGYDPDKAVKAVEENVVKTDDTTPKTDKELEAEYQKKNQERQEKKIADDKIKSDVWAAKKKAMQAEEAALRAKMDAGHGPHKPIWHRHNGKMVYD